MRHLSQPMVFEERFLAAYDDHVDAIFRYFYYRVSDREQALDLAQETFTRTWQYLSEGKDVKNLRAFLYQVARNLMIDLSRKKKAYSLDELREQGFDPGEDLRPTMAIQTDARTAHSKMLLLEEQYREILLMRFVDGFSPREIARTIGESENVVSVRIHRGLKKLRILLSE